MAKKVDEEELTDIFYVNCFINYDTGLAKIPTEWLVNNIIDGKIGFEYNRDEGVTWKIIGKEEDETRTFFRNGYKKF